MSCGAFGGSGTCGGGGGGAGGLPPIGGGQMPRRCADRGFFDPFCMPVEKPRCEPSCYFNPFVHAQCLGVDMNMQGFRNDILKCQEDYKKAVWAVLKKYAVGEGEKKGDSDNANNFAGGTNCNNVFRDLGMTHFLKNLSNMGNFGNLGNLGNMNGNLGNLGNMNGNLGNLGSMNGNLGNLGNMNGNLGNLGNMNNNFSNLSNMKRSSSIPVDPNGFQFDDPRIQRNRRSISGRRPMQA